MPLNPENPTQETQEFSSWKAGQSEEKNNQVTDETLAHSLANQENFLRTYHIPERMRNMFMESAVKNGTWLNKKEVSPQLQTIIEQGVAQAKSPFSYDQAQEIIVFMPNGTEGDTTYLLARKESDDNKLEGHSLKKHLSKIVRRPTFQICTVTLDKQNQIKKSETWENNTGVG